MQCYNTLNEWRDQPKADILIILQYACMLIEQKAFNTNFICWFGLIGWLGVVCRRRWHSPSIPSAEREQNVGIWCRNNRFHCINWATSNNTPMSKVHQGRQSAQRIWKEFRSDKSVCKRDFGHIILGWLLLPSLVMLDHRGQTNASCQLHWSESVREREHHRQCFGKLWRYCLW